ncbi:MAG TPA: protein-glutamate O-methyltransferase CheR, partial [Chloroflexota bacterium]|nr:protein-glutamate O-methyltransferase CheR [Chloroflexota bacterium]
MPELTPAESHALRRLVARETGLSFDSSGLSRLHAAVQQRLAAGGHASVADYLRLLGSPQGTSELAALVDLITVPETRFFRDPRQFALLQHQLLPELARARRAAGEPPRLRLWSTACATGEEAYSLALVALEALPGWQVQVLATDISQRWLRIAARGHYPARRLEHVPPALRARYFEQRGAEYVAGPQLRAAVTFQHLNLVAEHLVLAVPPPMDVILCENVLIYLEREAISRLAASLHAALRDDGYLLLSVSEALWRTSAQFTLEVRDGVFLHRKAPRAAP